MTKTFFFTFLFIILASQIVYAEIDYFVATFIIPDQCGDGLCTGLETCLTCGLDCGICSYPGGTGDAHYGAKREDYEMSVEVKNILVTGISMVESKVTLFNTGKYTDRNAYLHSYFKAPDDKIYAENTTYLGEIEPACKEGSYDKFNDVCIYYNGTEYTPKKYVTIFKNPIPKGTPIGKWRFYAEFQSESTFKLVAWDDFELYTGILLTIILIGFVLILAFRRRQNKKRELNKKKRKYRRR